MISNIAVYFSAACEDAETVHPEDIWTLEIATCAGDTGTYSVSLKGAASHAEIAAGLHALAQYIMHAHSQTYH